MFSAFRYLKAFLAEHNHSSDTCGHAADCRQEPCVTLKILERDCGVAIYTLLIRGPDVSRNLPEEATTGWLETARWGGRRITTLQIILARAEPYALPPSSGLINNQEGKSWHQRRPNHLAIMAAHPQIMVASSTPPSRAPHPSP